MDLESAYRVPQDQMLGTENRSNFVDQGNISQTGVDTSRRLSVNSCKEEAVKIGCLFFRVVRIQNSEPEPLVIQTQILWKKRTVSLVCDLRQNDMSSIPDGPS